MPYPRIVDLFSGAGGFSLGAHLAGFRTALAVELDPDLCSRYRENFPEAKLLVEDLAQLESAAAAAAAGLPPGAVAGVIGGPPCQGFSVIGKRDPEDPRNGLVGHFFRFVKALRPDFFVMENVPGILDDPFRGLLTDGIHAVGPGYEIVGPMLVNAADFGAATQRERALVLGYRPGAVHPLAEADIREAQTPPATTRAAISDLPPPADAHMDRQGDYWARYGPQAPPDLPEYARRARSAPAAGLASDAIRRTHAAGLVSGFQPTAHTEAVRKRFSALPAGGVDRVSRAPRLEWRSPCPTLRAGTGKDRGSFQALRPIHPQEDRVITVREAARLQGFPDWFLFHPTRWHSFRMIGNSVSPYVAEAILRLLGKRLNAGAPPAEAVAVG